MSVDPATKTALITGGCGFIGSNLAEALLSCQWSVILVDNQCRGSVGDEKGLLTRPRVRHREVNICDAASLDGVRGDIDLIVHAAGYLGVENVTKDPIRTLDVNISGTRAVMAFAARRNVSHVVYLSSSEIYGLDACVVAEDSPTILPSLDPRWSYATSKFAAEHYVRAFGDEYGVRASIVRPFNVYGPERRGGYAVGEFTRRALSGRQIRIHGDGRQRRSWCHVADFCAGLMTLVGEVDAQGDIYNLGNPDAYLSIRELADRLIQRVGSTSDVVTIPSGVDVRDRRPDIFRARNRLGYEPVISLEDGLNDVIMYQRALLERR